MCGLVGIFDPRTLAPREVLEPALNRLLSRIRHRGPDGEGVAFEDGLALGHRRLSILDLSPTGAQPMVSHDGRFVAVYNGEIYNHRQMRADLPGPWRGSSDTETLLEAVSHVGLAEALPLTCGMFAFALYDRDERRLHLIRDRFGIKPLFYARRPEGGWIFGSEARGIGAAVNDRISREMLSDYLSWGYPPPGRTLFETVLEVAPGEIITLSAEGLSRRRYYDLPLTGPRSPSERDQDDAFDSAFRRSVKEHQMSDVPIGVLLSSGVDSSAVAIAAAQSQARVSAFTVRFSDKGLDESADAERLARSLGLPVVSLQVDGALHRDTFDAVAASSDLPLADSSNVGTWLIARAASKHVKVLLTGDGADETWAGYETYKATALVGSALGQGLRLGGNALDLFLGAPPPRPGRPNWRVKLSRFARHAKREPLEAHRRWRTLVDDASLHELGLGSPAPDGFAAQLGSAGLRSGTDAALALDIATYLVQDELVRLDRMGMAHGVEGRVPFLDHRLVELAFSWSGETKLRAGTGKRPVRRWLRHNGFPQPAHAKKRGFNHPVSAWMSGNPGDWLVDERIHLEGLVEGRAIERWLAEHRAGGRDRSYELFALLNLSSWLRSVKG